MEEFSIERGTILECDLRLHESSLEQFQIAIAYDSGSSRGQISLCHDLVRLFRSADEKVDFFRLPFLRLSGLLGGPFTALTRRHIHRGRVAFDSMFAVIICRFFKHNLTSLVVGCYIARPRRAVSGARCAVSIISRLLASTEVSAGYFD